MTAPTQVLAWRGDPAIKAEAVARMRAHREADEFMQNTYGEMVNGRLIGCFHGCLTVETLAAERGVDPETLLYSRSGNDNAHLLWSAGERLWGIPVDLAEQLDRLFEEFSREYAAGDWAVEVTEAIPVGADLSGVAGQFSAALDDSSASSALPTLQLETLHALLADLMVQLLAAAPVPALALSAS